MFRKIKNRWNRHQKRRNVSKEVSELLSPASIEKSKNIPQQLRNLLLEKIKQEQNNDKELNSVIEGISDGIENLIDNYIELVLYKEKVQRTRRTFQRTMSFFLLVLSGAIIFLVSSLLINELSRVIIFTLVVGALVGIFPISYIAYSFYKSEVQKERLANDLRLLGLVSEQNIDEINELYSTVYNPFQFGVYIVLFVTLSSLIFASYYIVTTGNEFSFIETNTVKIIFYAFLGSYFFGIQLLVRRYNTFDLQPQVYSAVILRTLLAAVITFSIASLIGFTPQLPSPKDTANTTPTIESPVSPSNSQPETTPPPKQDSANGMDAAQSTLPWQVLAFLIGIFPTRGVRWINFVTNRALNAPIDLYNEYPLKNIFGINTWHEARLSELGIDNVQSLATTDISKLLLSTQFDTQQIINWVDQAILYMKVGAKIERFREINISTFHELQNALIDFGLHHAANQEATQNTTADNQNNNCNQHKQKRPLSVLGFASLDEDEISILRDYSNYQNYNHIKAYYENAPEVARKQAASGKEFVINSLNRDFNILTITGGLAYPEAQDAVPIRRHISISLINQKEIEIEIRKLKEFLKENPENAKEYVYLGVAHYLLNQSYEAGKAYDKAISLQPSLAPAYSNRSVIYIQAKRYDEAIQDTRKAIHLNPHFAEAFSNLGLAQLGLNDAFSAIESLTKALELNPRLEAAYCYRGIAYNTIAAGESQFLSAIEDFEIANLLGYESPVLWTTWGVALCSLGKYSEGIEKYDQALAHSKVTSARLYARRGYANLQLGLASYSQSQVQQGANYYRRANHDFYKATAEKDNASTSAFTNYGLLKSYEGDIKAREGRNEEASKLYEDAIQKYTKAIAISNQRATDAENQEEQREGGGLSVVHRNLAIVHQKLGKHKDAKTHYEEAIKLGDKTVETYFNYGVSLHETKNLEKALEAFLLVAKDHSDSCLKLIEKAQDYINKINTEIEKSH